MLNLQLNVKNVLFQTYCIGVNQKITKYPKLNINKLNKEYWSIKPNSIWQIKYNDMNSEIDNNN